MIFLLRNKRGFGFMEYAILLAVVSAALIAMNTYMKRGIQGKLKDMTTYFIGNEQSEDSSTSSPVSHTASSEVADVSQDYLPGGVMRVASNSVRDIVSNSTVNDTSPTVIPTGVSTAQYASANASNITTPPYNSTTGDNMDPQWQAKSSRTQLVIARNNLLNEAANYMSEANTTKTSGYDLIRSANDMDCDDEDDCEDAQRALRRQGYETVMNATYLVDKATAKLTDAQKLLDQINALNTTLGASNVTVTDASKLTQQIEDAQSWKQLLTNTTGIQNP